MRTLTVLACGLLIFARPVSGLERLTTARPDAYKPVPLKNGEPYFHIPADCRLARDEHPRFLLVKEDLAVLRKRIEDPVIAAEFRAVCKQALRRPPAEGIALFKCALAYKLTGDEKYLDALKGSPAFTRPTWIFGWAAAIDLVWEDLGVQERRRLSDAVAEAVSKGGDLYWRPTLHLVAVFYEGGKGKNDHLFLARMRHDFERALVRWTDKLNRWAAGRGGSDMGHGYNGEHAYWEPFVAAICWANCTGEDYIGRADFARFQSPFYWYHFVPQLKPLCVEHIGVTRQCTDRGAVAPGHSGSTNLVWLTIAREDDGLGLVWMKYLREQEPAWSRMQDALGRLLWQEPSQEPLDYRTLPTTRLFPTSGHVIMRSDWSEDCTFATFRCGRYGEIDGLWGRNNADNLSFTIRKHGPLAIDSGPVHSQNTQVLNFPVLRGAEPASAVYDYGRQTIAHNSILVGRGEFVHKDWRGQPTRDVVRCGGQSVRQDKSWWKKWGFAGPQKDFMEGRITAYRTHPLFDYALGDARFSYDPDWAREITRQFIYLKPDVFVVYDRVVVADAARRPCWLLHSLREPHATGGEKPLAPEEIGPQYIITEGGRRPHPHPGGHFWMSGDAFVVESGTPGKKRDGWLYVRTLVPAAKDAERKKVGGKWHDFEVCGIQYGPTEEGYGKAESAYAVRSTIGLLGWRVELRHKKPAASVEFLHVMQVGTGDLRPEAAAGATLSSTASDHTLRFGYNGRTFLLTLNRTGPRGGRIKIAEGGKILYDERLPDVVEDHWRYYRNDPNFKLWATDPRYRIIITPTDEDRALARNLR